MFARDDETAALHREATALKKAGDMHGAIEKLKAAKARMLVSPVSYPNDTWCRLALVLQQAGLYEESMAEFDFLLNDLERRFRKEFFIDDPDVSCGEPKAALVRRSVGIHRVLIMKSRALAEKREAAKSSSSAQTKMKKSA